MMAVEGRPTGGEALIVELPEGDKWREVPCWVSAEGAGGPCKRPSVVRVYGLPFCEAHSAEVRAGALEELYSDAAQVLERLDNPSVPEPNPEAIRLVRAAVSGLTDRIWETVREGGRRPAPCVPLPPGAHGRRLQGLRLRRPR